MQEQDKQSPVVMRKVQTLQETVYDANTHQEFSQKLMVHDIPKRIAKPTDVYGSMVVSFVFDTKRNMFVYQKPHGSKSPQSTKQLLLLTSRVLPNVMFGMVGFFFDKPKFLKKLKALPTSERSQDSKALAEFAEIKANSLVALRKIAKGSYKKAEDRLSRYEPIVTTCEDCEFTAWHYVARFWLEVQRIRQNRPGTRQISVTQKSQLIDLLRRARAGFQAENEVFNLMLSLDLWWKFLVEADLITTDISTAKTTRYTLSDEAFDDAKKTLQQFLVERDRTGLYPIDNKYQNDAIQLFNDYRSVNKPKLAVDDKLHVSNGMIETDTDGHDESTDSALFDLVFKEYRRKVRGRLPSCIVRSIPKKEEDKIVILTTSLISQEFEEFKQLIDYEEHKHRFEFKLAYPIMAFTRSFAGAEHRSWVGPNIGTNSVVMCVEKSAYMEAVANNDFSQLHAVDCWTLGLLVQDSRTKKFFIATSAHGVVEHDSFKPPVVFITNYAPSPDHNILRYEIICDKFYTGFFGGHDYVTLSDGLRHHVACEEKLTSVQEKVQSVRTEATDADESPYLIDSLLLPVEVPFLNKKHVEIVNRNYKGDTGKFAIYTGIIDSKLIGTRVFIHGNRSAKRKGRIVQTDIDFNVRKYDHTISFAVQLDDDRRNAGSTFALPGDSGAPVIGMDTVDGYHLIYGLVYGGWLGEAELQGRDEVNDEDIRQCMTTNSKPLLTLCTAYTHPLQYYQHIHDMDVEAGTFDKPKDSAYYSGVTGDDDADQEDSDASDDCKGASASGAATTVAGRNAGANRPTSTLKRKSKRSQTNNTRGSVYAWVGEQWKRSEQLGHQSQIECGDETIDSDGNTLTRARSYDMLSTLRVKKGEGINWKFIENQQCLRPVSPSRQSSEVDENPELQRTTAHKSTSLPRRHSNSMIHLPISHYTASDYVEGVQAVSEQDSKKKKSMFQKFKAMCVSKLKSNSKAKAAAHLQGLYSTSLTSSLDNTYDTTDSADGAFTSDALHSSADCTSLVFARRTSTQKSCGEDADVESNYTS